MPGDTNRFFELPQLLSRWEYLQRNSDASWFLKPPQLRQMTDGELRIILKPL